MSVIVVEGDAAGTAAGGAAGEGGELVSDVGDIVTSGNSSTTTVTVPLRVPQAGQRTGVPDLTLPPTLNLLLPGTSCHHPRTHGRPRPGPVLGGFQGRGKANRSTPDDHDGGAGLLPVHFRRTDEGIARIIEIEGLGMLALWMVHCA